MKKVIVIILLILLISLASCSSSTDSAQASPSVGGCGVSSANEDIEEKFLQTKQHNVEIKPLPVTNATPYNYKGDFKGISFIHFYYLNSETSPNCFQLREVPDPSIYVLKLL